MASQIYLSIFARQSDEVLYQAYLKLKYQVFVEELGCHSLVNGSKTFMAKEDPFDDQGRFMMALTSEGLPVGVIRGIALKDGFPHRDLFEHHFSQPQVDKMFSHICTLNVLAVLPAYRSKVFRVTGCDWEGSIAKLIVLGIIRSFERESLKACIATAEGLVVRFFQRLGFLLLDRPSVTHLHQDLLTNVGLVFGSSAHLKAQDDCKMGTARCSAVDENALNLLNYFKRCQEGALSSNTLGSFFEPHQ